MRDIQKKECCMVDPDDHNVLLLCDNEGEHMVTGERLAQHYNVGDYKKAAAAFTLSWSSQGQRSHRTGDLAISDMAWRRPVADANDGTYLSPPSSQALELFLLARPDTIKPHI